MSTLQTVLVIGSTGQIGRVVVDEALTSGLTVLAQTRNASRATRILPHAARVIEADPADAHALRPVLAEADAVVLTHGGESDGHSGQAFYNILAALLEASDDKPEMPISLMTSMGVSKDPALYEFMAWKRRAERLLRASGRRYTIVRPGWFGYESDGDNRIDLRQGDLVGGQPGVSRRHVAQTLLGALTAPSATRRTVEVFSAPGDPFDSVEDAFAGTTADEPGSGKGALDATEVPLDQEPTVVRNTIVTLTK
ncbi:NAD(P)H-binding protein [Arcanobacterium haemolyticum]|nr:NAD(P)H-binding protein [Arcanobacterium haemolyticum]